MKCSILPVTPFQQNCSIIWDEGTRCAAVIDPGGEIGRVLDLIRAEGLSLEKILVTHGHLDHASGVAELAERTGVPVEGPHPDDSFLIEALPEHAREYGFPPARSFVPQRWLAHGDEVEAAGARFRVVHCPGHTPGHVVYFEPQARVAFVGDVLFAGSIGRTDFPRGEHAALIASIRKRLFTLGDDVRFVPGHGPMSSFGRERASNPYVADRLFPPGS